MTIINGYLFIPINFLGQIKVIVISLLIFLIICNLLTLLIKKGVDTCQYYPGQSITVGRKNEFQAPWSKQPPEKSSIRSFTQLQMVISSLILLQGNGHLSHFTTTAFLLT